MAFYIDGQKFSGHIIAVNNLLQDTLNVLFQEEQSESHRVIISEIRANLREVEVKGRPV